MGILRRSSLDAPDADADAVASTLANMERLVALASSRLLEQAGSPRLDGLAARAAAGLGAPMAFVDVIDATDVHLVGAVGLEGVRTNPASASYCQYVVSRGDVLVVEDATADPRLVDNPSTVDLGVRAYLGVPIRHDGQTLGSFCVVDTQPRSWTDDDLAALRVLADDVLAPRA